MRVEFLAAFFLCALTSFAEGQTGGAAPTTTTYFFLIDASGSMKSLMDDAENIVQARMHEVNAVDSSALFSRTYFRADTSTDGASCSKPVDIAPAFAAANSSPAEQSASGSTPLGTALDSALTRAGTGPAKIIIVSDGSQTLGCGVDICSIASARLPQPGVSVEFVPVGNIDPANGDRLGCIAGVQTAPRKIQPHVSRSSQQQNDNPWDAIARGTWIATLLFGIASAIAFGLHYSRQSSELERRIKQGFANSPETSSAGNVNAKEFAKPSWCGRLLVCVALVLALLMWLTHWPYFSVARHEALANLDTEFGAAVFLAGSLSLAGWSGSQYWRFFEARRDYYIATNRAEMENRGRERRKRERLLDAYNRDRQAILLYEYESDRRRIASRLNMASDDVKVQELVAGLVGRAIGVQRTADDVVQGDIDRVSKFRNLFVMLSLTRLVAALGEVGALNAHTAANLQSLLSLDSGGDVTKLREQLDQILVDIGNG